MCAIKMDCLATACMEACQCWPVAAAGHLGEREAVEVAQQAVGDGRAAAPGRPHGRHKLHVGQRAECRVAPVPAALANGLTQELQRWLRNRASMLRSVILAFGERAHMIVCVLEAVFECLCGACL